MHSKFLFPQSTWSSYLGKSVLSDQRLTRLVISGKIKPINSAMLITARNLGLGPAAERKPGPGGIPLERYDDGKILEPVHEKTRCYAQGLTFQRPRALCSPNANAKTYEGAADRSSQIRADLLKASILLHCAH